MTFSIYVQIGKGKEESCENLKLVYPATFCAYTNITHSIWTMCYSFLLVFLNAQAKIKKCSYMLHFPYEEYNVSLDLPYAWRQSIVVCSLPLAHVHTLVNVTGTENFWFWMSIKIMHCRKFGIIEETIIHNSYFFMYTIFLKINTNLAWYIRSIKMAIN